VKHKQLEYYMRVCYLTANLSTAKRLCVGALLVKDEQIIGSGYNGTPTGWSNECEDKVWDTGAAGWLGPEEYLEAYPHEGWNPQSGQVARYALKTKPEVLHAEMNCIFKVARSTMSSEGSTMFCTVSPCMHCAKAIYQAGITTLYYGEHYRSSDGIVFLQKAGVEVVHFPLIDTN
jgi:dCMP deaminase